MRIAAIVPVGPGHERVSHEAIDSVLAARLPSGWEVEPLLVADEHGLLGRSEARNVGATEAGNADWILWLDADDILFPDAFELFASALRADPTLDVFHGCLWNESSRKDSAGREIPELIESERSPVCRAPLASFADLLDHGPFGGIHVGHFVRREVHERVGGWLPRLDIGEDVEYTWACAAHARAMLKIEEPLAKVRIRVPSAGGRRGYGKILPGANSKLLWLDRARKIRDYWRARGPVPWTDEERADRVSLYGPLGRWKEEPVKVCVVIPFGPGHEQVVEQSEASVRRAAERSAGFEIEVVVEDDSVNPRGRSRARNDAVARTRSEWLLFHDADDLLSPDAFETLAEALREDFAVELVWGEFWKERLFKDRDGNVLRTELLKCEEMGTPITTWEGMLAGGPLAGSRHAFIRRDLLERVGGWFEPMDIGEDLELVWAAAVHAESFRKVSGPICLSRLHVPAAHGPRGYDRNRQCVTSAWSDPGHAVFDYWKDRGRVPWTPEERGLRRAGRSLYRTLGERIEQ